MPAKSSGEPGSESPDTGEPLPEEHMSRAERRAASRGKAVHDTAPHWSRGKVTGARGAAPSRKQYSNRRSGGG
jgi:hypothetical protein